MPVDASDSLTDQPTLVAQNASAGGAIGAEGEDLMSAMKCERCGQSVPADSYELFDYCADCCKNLCEECMEKGCCGNVPATSGSEADNGEVDE